MGAKLEKEIVDLLKAICIYDKAILQEVQLLRKDIAKHSAEQQAALKEWMAKDLDHHYKDNNVALSAIDLIKETARKKDKGEMT